ncbi:hypothetical protein PR048_009429 [Dryococelus australis]|uniref:Peptidase A2 domain-containing protein n=1 Tax=Dryococelus australis TaxID=614101 RepID=A0ABQ9I001_9NEOP|nr:hypothetical protein PR048_009429 [Dryococelus australis]
MGEVDVNLKIDAGADVTVLLEDSFATLTQRTGVACFWRGPVEALGILRWLMETSYKVKLKNDAKPVRVAIPLQPRLKQELERLVKMEVIPPVDSLMEWCSGIMLVPKANGQIRLAYDYPLSRQILGTATKLRNAAVFSTLYADSGYWQLRLENESRLLTTFITPFGRFCFNRLLFGITSAPGKCLASWQTLLK